MKKLYFLFPVPDMQSGGHIAQKRIFDCASKLRPAEAILYGPRDEQFRHLNDLVSGPLDRDAIFIMHWGPHAQYLLNRLEGRNVVYSAYSVGWDLDVPPHVPILAGSQYTAGYWGRRAPRSPIYNIPHVLSDEFLQNNSGQRDIDVLVQLRKNSKYLLETLLPLLRSQCNVVLIDNWVPDLPSIFRRSKVYIYDSVEFWIGAGVTEGLGLPPLEALGAGCQVFSSINDGLSTYIDAGFVGEQIGVYSVQYDAMRILAAVRDYRYDAATPPILMNYTAEAVSRKLDHALAEIDSFFDFTVHHAADIPDVQPAPRLTDRKRRASRRWRHKTLARALAP